MRIAFANDYIIEVESITVTPGWNADSTGKYTNPDFYIVETDEPIGEYKLDGSIETFHAAEENFKQVCKQLLEKGYCRIEDFTNFRLY